MDDAAAEDPPVDDAALDEGSDADPAEPLPDVEAAAPSDDDPELDPDDPDDDDDAAAGEEEDDPLERLSVL